MIGKLFKFNSNQIIQKINELVDFINGLIGLSGDGLVEIKNSRNPTININMDRLRARIPKPTSSGSGNTTMVFCAESAGSGNTLWCYVGVSDYDSTQTYQNGAIVYYNNSFWSSLQNENSGNTPTLGTWWTSASGGNISVYFTLLGGISNLSDGHLTLVAGVPIPVYQRQGNWWCSIPIEGTEDCS